MCKPEAKRSISEASWNQVGVGEMLAECLMVQIFKGLSVLMPGNGLEILNATHEQYVCKSEAIGSKLEANRKQSGSIFDKYGSKKEAIRRNRM